MLVAVSIRVAGGVRLLLLLVLSVLIADLISVVMAMLHLSMF